MKIEAKKQFRLYDIYRYVATKRMSDIMGVKWYTVSEDGYEIYMKLTSGKDLHYVAHNEHRRKDVVREINRILGNTKKPGRRAKREVHRKA